MPPTKKLHPRTKPPEERRDELMNAAQMAFLEYGVAPTTIEQITSGARVAKGTFYLYFSSKEEILAALRERFARELLMATTSAVAQQPAEDWKGKLTSWARACVTGYLDKMALHDIVFYESRPPSREGLVDNVIIDHLFDLLRAGADAGAWSINDPRFTAVFLFSGLHGVVDDAHTKERRVNRNRLVQRVEQLCLKAVGLADS
jgi:AcrR family transcriptional regulator